MRTSSRVPSYRLHKPTGQAVVTLNGKDHYLGRHGTAASKEQYSRLIQEWLARGQQTAPEPGSTTGLTVNGLVLGYLRHAQEYYQKSPNELVKIKRAAAPLLQLYRRSPVGDFGPLALKAVRSKMLESQQRVFKRKVVENGVEKILEKTIHYHLTRLTVNRRVDIIRRMFRWGSENELVPPSVYHALLSVTPLRKGHTEAREIRKVKPVAEEHVEKVLPVVTRHVRGMIEFQRLTGARSGEVCLLRPCDIDTTGPVWVFRPFRHKNENRDQERLIYIGPKAQEVLKPFLSVPPDAFVFSPRRATEERYQLMRAARKSKVQPSQASRKKKDPKRKPGERYTVFSFLKAVTKACKKLGIPKWHPHQLRHLAATYLRKEFGVELARIILGHSTAFTTEIYAEVDRKKAMDAMNQVG